MICTVLVVVLAFLVLKPRFTNSFQREGFEGPTTGGYVGIGIGVGILALLLIGVYYNVVKSDRND
jgi:drug/metabolite transporter (DMT)-like permease